MKFAFRVFFFNYIKLLSNKGHYPNDKCQMMVLLWSFKCNVFGNYLFESYVVTNTLIDMALHVSPSTDKGSSFVAQNLLTLIHTLSSKQSLIRSLNRDL